MSVEPTLAEHREMVDRLFPALAPIERFEALGEGWTSFTYVANGGWVVQIPRGPYGEQTMVKQLDLLPGLVSEVSAPIPRPVHVSRDPLAMAYPLIAGEPFDRASDQGMWPERLGRFLYDLHLCPPEFVGMRARSAASVREERRAELASFRERVFPLLEPAERSQFDERFDAHLDEDANWRFATCLVHGDLGPEHVLVHPNGDLAGVIDWEEATIGDPSWDFAYLVHAFPGVGERALAAYGGPPDAGFRDRARFAFLQMPWHEVTYGLDSGKESLVRSGLAGVRARADM
jgi:aminoglycoside phosphotransferase (APT) family kinase protein